MFGECESESPRVPSPWDPFLPSPPSEASSLESAKFSGIPKLVPEVEEGNVEYKLKLTSISPARFDRLVTQLKWRLLEGGGQAYYELGVADSGALIGLSRNDLEQSLETLEMMAGEIGASVIVVKEIEVPLLMVALADKLSGYLDPETGGWANKMLSRRHRLVLSSDDLSTTPGGTTTESNTEDSTAESTDFETDTLTSCSTPADSSRALPQPTIVTSFSKPNSNPLRPTAQSSPSISPFDDDIALFSMEPEPSVDEDELRLDSLPPVEADTLGISVDIEIASVYKPRPIRKRALIPQGLPAAGHGRREQKSKEKKQQSWPIAHRVPFLTDVSTQVAADLTKTSVDSKETKAQLRRHARDKRRQEKHQAFLTSLTGHTAPPSIVESDDMHVNVQPLADATADDVKPVQPRVDGIDEDLTVLACAADKLAQLGSSVDALLTGEVPVAPAMEPRLIVEALIVRKLSLQEAYLDFSRF